MVVDYTLNPDDITAARLLAVGIRPQLELAVFAIAITALLAWSVSPWSYPLLPLLIGLTACLGGFRLTQIAKVRQAALIAFQRNPTLRRPTAASWDDRGVSIHPASAVTEKILWCELQALKKNQRIVLLQQHGGTIHAIPRRAFVDKTQLAQLERLARAGIKRAP